MIVEDLGCLCKHCWRSVSPAAPSCAYQRSHVDARCLSSCCDDVRHAFHLHSLERVKGDHTSLPLYHAGDVSCLKLDILQRPSIPRTETSIQKQSIFSHIKRECPATHRTASFYSYQICTFQSLTSFHQRIFNRNIQTPFNISHLSTPAARHRQTEDDISLQDHAAKTRCLRPPTPKWTL